MHTKTRTPGLAFLFVAAFGASELSAQEAASAGAASPEDHIVDGTVLNPGATVPMDIQFAFAGSGDDLEAAIVVPGANLRVELLEPLFTDEKFTFAFQEPGGTDRIECDLFRKRDDSFQGDCMKEGGGAPGQITVEPTGY